MNLRSTKTILLTLFIAFLVLSSFLYMHIQNTDEKGGITAMEAKVIADDVALKWSENATLVYVHGTRDPQDNGKYMAWGFTYAKSSNSNISIGIHVFSDGSTYDELGTHYSFEYAIHNWTIDSDEAYSIAMENEEIKSFMERYHNAHVDSFSLSGRQDGNPVWSIEWVDWGLWDDPHWAEIRIDATTGEVLYVEAAPGSSLSIQDVCIGAFLVLIAVVAVAVLIVRKKSRKEQEKRRLEEEKINMEKEIRKWDEEHGKRG